MSDADCWAIFPEIYADCLEQAKKGSMRHGNSDGAVMYTFFKQNGLIIFRNRNRRKREFLSGYGLSCSGFQEHAEQAVVNDAIKFAKDYGDVIVSAMLFIAGYKDSHPYLFTESVYTCMNCASYMKNVMPFYTTFVFIPSRDGWFCLTLYDAYKLAIEINAQYEKPGDFRRSKMVCEIRGVQK